MLSRLFRPKTDFMQEARVIMEKSLGSESLAIPDSDFRIAPTDFGVVFDGVRIGFHGLSPLKRILRLSIYPLLVLPRLYQDRVESAAVDSLLLGQVLDGRLVRVSYPYVPTASRECLVWEKDVVSEDAGHLEMILGFLLPEVPRVFRELEPRLQAEFAELERSLADEEEVMA